MMDTIQYPYYIQELNDFGCCNKNGFGAMRKNMSAFGTIQTDRYG